MCPERAARLSTTTLLLMLLSLWPTPALGEAVQKLRVEVSTEMRYDSGARPGGDVAGRLLPRLGYERTSARSAFELDYGVDLIRHLSATRLSLDHRAELTWRLQATRRLEVRALGALYRVEESTSLPRFGVAYSEAGALWSFVELRAAHRLDRTVQIEVSARSDWNQLLFQRGEPQTPLSGMQVLQVSQRHYLSRRVQLGWAARGQIFSAGESLLGSSGALLFVSRFQLGHHSTLSLDAGPRLYRGKSASAWDPQLRLQFDWARRGLELALIGGRDYVSAAGFASTLWTEFLQGGIGVRLARHLRTFGYLGAFRNGLAPDSEADAVGYGVSLGLEWAFSEEFLARLVFDRLGQFDIAGHGYAMDRNIVTLRVGYRMR
ncbi:MAG: hypothetical protein LBM75_04720 [Myxococcales bacterium]|jgi:hypothetical protein|nr:hypothetical protein [Myxococcales bacterium]